MDKKSKVELSKIEHAWVINNHDILETHLGEEIISPTFYIRSNSDLQGRFIFFPRGFDRSTPREYASLFLQFKSGPEEAIDGVLQFSLFSLSEGQEIARCQSTGTIAAGKSLGFGDFVRCELIYPIKTDSKGLIIMCTICLFVPEDPKTNILYENKTNVNCNVEDSSYILKNENKYNLDQTTNHMNVNSVTLSCKGTKFYADKNIVGAQSSILASMFENNTLENKVSNIVEFDDLQPEVLQEILRFIYTGTIQNWKLGSKLLEAANKYELNELKNLCEHKLFNQMNLDNVFGILVLADQYKINRLKQQALEIIVLYAKWAVKTPGFQLFMKSKKVHLISETFKALAKMNNFSESIDSLNL